MSYDIHDAGSDEPVSNDNDTPTNRYLALFQRYKKQVIAGVSIVAVLVSILSCLGWRNGVENEGEAIEVRIEETWQNAQSSLSACLDEGRIAAQVTSQEWEELKALLTDVASARYRDPESGQLVTDAEQAIGGGAAFSAVIEAYPQVSQEGWTQLRSTVVGCREEFQGKQDRIFAETAALEFWISQNTTFDKHIRNNFPSNGLTAIDYATGETLKGQAAFDYIDRVIMVDDAREAYGTGELGEQDLFPDDEE